MANPFGGAAFLNLSGARLASTIFTPLSVTFHSIMQSDALISRNSSRRWPVRLSQPKPIAMLSPILCVSNRALSAEIGHRLRPLPRFQARFSVSCHPSLYFCHDDTCHCIILFLRPTHSSFFLLGHGSRGYPRAASLEKFAVPDAISGTLC